MSSQSTGIKALDQINQLIHCLDDVLNSTNNKHIPRRSFPNTSLDFQCRKFTTLFNHIRGHLQYQDFQYFSTCLRIKYPQKTIEFFVKNFGMVLLDKKELTDLRVTFYFLISPRSPHKDKYPLTASKESEQLLWSYAGGVLQLRYDHDSNNDPEFKINNGNVEPHRGFGHIAFNTNDVYAACQKLEENGVQFQKKPNEGRMKGLAFALDPNGYWIEVVKRAEKGADFEVEYNLSQTMLRIKNPEHSLKFYCDFLGMRLINELHFEKGQFSLYFLSSFVDDVDLDEMDDAQRYLLMKQQFHPILELTHNWGTEADDSFEYHNGNDICPLGQGFVHVSFLVDNLKEAVQRLKENDAEFKPLPKYLQHKQGETGFTFLLDPDDYTVEILQRGQSPVNPHKQ